MRQVTYFNLYHIWGDDNGACSGTDYVDDTPNQAGSTNGCYSGVHTDGCTTEATESCTRIMDYSYDNCMMMFTTQGSRGWKRPCRPTGHRCFLLMAVPCSGLPVRCQTGFN